MASPSQYRIWWLNPGWAITLALLPFALASYFIPDEQYLFYWRVPRHFAEEDLAFVFVSIVAFLFGGLASRIGSAGPVNAEWGKFSAREIAFLFRTFYLGITLTLTAYLVWICVGFQNGLSFRLLGEALIGRGGAIYETKDLLTTIPGITTGIQFEMAVFIIGIILCFNGKARQVSGWLVFLVPVVILRTIFNSERLALVEVAAPCICLLAYYGRKRLTRYLRGLPSVMWPVGAVVMLYFLFTGAEYGRAWTTFYEDEGEYSSVWEFSLMRLIGYYVTALNNGCQMYRALGMRPFPWATFEWFWRFPIIGPWVHSFVPAESGESFFSPSNYDANPEFNNFSGIFDYALDWGEIGAVVFFFLAGFLIFRIYRWFIAGNASGLLIYPLLYVGILELCRTLYWTAPRAFPSWALLLLAAYGMRRVRKKQARAEHVDAMLAGAFEREPSINDPNSSEIAVTDLPSDKAKEQT